MVQPLRRTLTISGDRPKNQFLTCLIVLTTISATFTAGNVPTTRAATLASWNQHVQCTPLTVRVTDITANQTGSASFTASKFNPGITTTVPGGVAKRWLTPGPTPPGWVSPGPQCTVTNSKGTTSLYVEIDGIERGSLTTEDSATSYDPTNGGTSHPKTYDTTFNIFDPKIVPNYDTSCTSPTDPTCYGRIHLEIDHDWMAAAYCGKNTTCDPSTLASQTSRNSTKIDVQGFVYWDPANLNSQFHSYNGWELHPLTGWRLSPLTPLVAGAISPSNPTIDRGQSITLTANPSAGTTPYGYQWYQDGTCTTSISGATGSTYLASPSSTTTYSYKVTDSESPPASKCSAGDTVTVDPLLVAGAITPSSPKIDLGQTITLTTNPSAGTPPYSLQWYTGTSCGTLISGATSSTYAASPGSTSTYSYKVNDSSFSPVSMCSPGDTVTVSPGLAAGAVTPSAPTIDNGQSITLTANPSGGTTPYSYQWYSGPSASCSSDTALLGTASTQVVTPTANTYYCYKLTDGSTGKPAASATSPTDLVTVNQTLIAGAITPSAPTINNGQSINLTANPSGGTTPYSYQWYSDGVCSAGILGATAASYTASPASNTTYSYRVTDSAYSPVSQCSPGDTVVVNAINSVGGVILSTDRLAILAPYVSTVGILLAVAGTLTYLRRRREGRSLH